MGRCSEGRRVWLRVPQGLIVPNTFKLPSAAGRTTTPSADEGYTPVSAVMLTWCENTTSTPGPCQRVSTALAWAVCASLMSADARKDELNAGSSLTASPNARRAVSRVRHHCDVITAPTVILRLRNCAPSWRASARPLSFRSRCVGQSLSLKPGGSRIPGAAAWRSKTMVLGTGNSDKESAAHENVDTSARASAEARKGRRVRIYFMERSKNDMQAR